MKMKLKFLLPLLLLPTLVLGQTIPPMSPFKSNATSIQPINKSLETVLFKGLTVGNSTSTLAGTIRYNGTILQLYNGSTWTSIGSGGSGVGGGWATNSANTILYPADLAHIVVIGADSTSSAGTIFETNGNAYIKGVLEANRITTTAITTTHAWIGTGTGLLEAIAGKVGVTSSVFALQSALTDYATKLFVTTGYVASTTLDTYATKSFVSTGYVASTTLSSYIPYTYGSSTFITYGYGTSTFIPFSYGTGTFVSLPYATNTFATKSFVNDGYVASTTLSSYATQAFVSTGYVASTTLSDYATKLFVSTGYLSTTTPYVSNEYASSTFVALAYATDTFPTYNYGTSTYVSFPYASGTYGTLAYNSSTFGTLAYNSSTFGTLAYNSSTFVSFPYATATFPSLAYATTNYSTYGYGSSTYLIKGTLASGKICTYTGANNIIDCNTDPAAATGFTTTTIWSNIPIATTTFTLATGTPPTGLDFTIVGNEVLGKHTFDIDLTNGYGIPLIASSSNWTTAYDKVNASSTNWDNAYFRVSGGTLTNTKYCTWNSTLSAIDCNSEGGSGSFTTTSINDLATTTFAFTTGTDTNIGLTITTSSTGVLFTPTWIGTLADSRITNAANWMTYDYGSSTYINFTYGSTTFGTYDYNTSTFSSFAYNSSTFPSFNYVSTTFGTFAYNSSTFGTLTYNSSTFPSFSYGTSTYADKLNYPSYTYASGTFPTFSYTSTTFIGFGYASSTFPSFTYASTTFPSFSYGSSTYVNFSYATNTFPTFAYSSSTFVTYGYGTSTYADKLNYPSYTYGTSTYADKLSYPSYTYASNTFVGFAYATNTFPTYTYASSTFPSFAYTTSTFVLKGMSSTTNLTVDNNSYLGTVKTGVWNGTVIGLTYGGTGKTTAPTIDQILWGNAGGTYDLRRLVAGSNITISTSTAGQVVIASTATGGGANYDLIWATSATNGLLIHPTSSMSMLTADFAIGSNATATAPFWFDSSATTSYIGNGGTGDSVMTLGSAMSMGYDYSAGVFAISTSTTFANPLMTMNTSTKAIGMGGFLGSIQYCNFGTSTAVTTTISWASSTVPCYSNTGVIRLLSQVKEIQITDPPFVGSFSLTIIQGTSSTSTIAVWDSEIAWEGGFTPSLPYGTSSVSLLSCQYKGAMLDISGKKYLCQFSKDYK